MAGKDQFFNRAYATVYEDGVDTLTFAELESGFGLLEKRAWLIHRIEYYLLPVTVNYIVDGADGIRFGLSTSNAINDVGLERPNVLDLKLIGQMDLSAVGFQIYEMPVVTDYNNMPGGGMLIIPKPLYIFTEGISLASQTAVEARIYFTVKELSPPDFLQLLESFRMVA